MPRFVRSHGMPLFWRKRFFSDIPRDRPSNLSTRGGHTYKHPQKRDSLKSSAGRRRYSSTVDKPNPTQPNTLENARPHFSLNQQHETAIHGAKQLEPWEIHKSQLQNATLQPLQRLKTPQNASQLPTNRNRATIVPLPREPTPCIGQRPLAHLRGRPCPPDLFPGRRRRLETRRTFSLQNKYVLYVVPASEGNGQSTSSTRR